MRCRHLEWMIALALVTVVAAVAGGVFSGAQRAGAGIPAALGWAVGGPVLLLGIVPLVLALPFAVAGALRAPRRRTFTQALGQCWGVATACVVGALVVTGVIGIAGDLLGAVRRHLPQ